MVVQWCGLEWAWKVFELCELRDDPVLRAAAEGVARSGLQQMFDRRPWTGLYPDVWNVEEGWAGGALIAPRLLVNALRAGGHIPQELRVWSRRLGEGREAFLVHGWGELLSSEGGPGGLTVTLRFLENEPGEILVARSPRPRSVAVGGSEAREGTPESGASWRHDAELRLVSVRFVAPVKELTVTVRYP